MKAGRRPRDPALIESLFAKRVAQVEAQTGEKETWIALAGLVEDFTGMRDVAKFAAREAELRQSKIVKDGLKKDRAEEQREEHFAGHDLWMR